MWAAYILHIFQTEKKRKKEKNRVVSFKGLSISEREFTCVKQLQTVWLLVYEDINIHMHT